jgi:hypothetical protein
MTDLLAALGLAIALEGMAYALFPAAIKKVMARVFAEPVSTLRYAGVAAATLGVVLVWLVRG